MGHLSAFQTVQSEVLQSNWSGNILIKNKDDLPNFPHLLGFWTISTRREKIFIKSEGKGAKNILLVYSQGIPVISEVEGVRGVVFKSGF